MILQILSEHLPACQMMWCAVFKCNKMNGYTFMFSRHFYKGKQLLWLPIYFPGWCIHFKVGSTLKGKNLLLWSKFFPLRVDPHWEEKQKLYGRVASPENILNLLQIMHHDLTDRSFYIEGSYWRWYCGNRRRNGMSHRCAKNCRRDWSSYGRRKKWTTDTPPTGYA